MTDIIKDLTDKDDKKAYARTREIAAASALSNEYYEHFDEFASLLEHPKSYVRTRAFVLCCSQARWDRDGKIRLALPRLLPLLRDPKPTVVRQCLSAVREVLVFLPELGPDIRQAVESIDLSQYKDSMAPLIQKDIRAVLELL